MNVILVALAFFIWRRRVPICFWVAIVTIFTTTSSAPYSGTRFAFKGGLITFSICVLRLVLLAFGGFIMKMYQGIGTIKQVFGDI